MGNKILNFDLEARGLQVFSQFLLGGTKSASGCEVQIQSRPHVFVDKLLDHLDAGGVLACHNMLSYDIPLLYYLGTLDQKFRWREHLSKNATQFIDTCILSRMLIERNYGYGLKTWGEKFQALGLLAEGKQEVEDFATADMETIKKRLVGDVEIQSLTTEYLLEQLGGVNDGNHMYMKVYKNSIDYFCMCALSLGEGIPIDDAEFKRYGYELKKKAFHTSIMSKIKLKVGEDFNPNSRLQVHNALIKLKGTGLPLGEPSEKTQKRNPQLNKHNKDIVLALHPELKTTSLYMDTVHQKNFFIKDKEDSKQFLKGAGYDPFQKTIHPSLGMMNQITYRSSYKNPPINQMGKSIRSVFKREGWVWVGVDVKALEMSIIGTVIEDLFGQSAIIDEVREGKNAKNVTVEVFGNLLENVPEDDRAFTAKTYNYAKIYGQGMVKSMALLRIPPSREQEFLGAERSRFPALDQLEEYLAKNSHRGKITNLYGLKLRPKENALINGFAQSTGAIYSYMILGLYYKQFYLNCQKEDVLMQPILVNHDEAQFGVHTMYKDVSAIAHKTKRYVEEKFEAITKEKLIAGLDITLGSNWGESH